MSDVVFVNGLILHAHHGVAEHERRVGQPFILDLELEMNLEDAARSDKLADTASYDDIVQVVSGAFQTRHYRLVEAAAGAVIDAVLDRFPRVDAVRIAVRKPHAPIAAVFTDVGAKLYRKRHA
jgi:dihydroneopterin aldolase